MRDLNLDALVDATRAVDRPSPEYADALFDRIVSLPGAPPGASSSGDSLPPQVTAPHDVSNAAGGAGSAASASATAGALGASSKWMVVGVVTALGVGGVGAAWVSSSNDAQDVPPKADASTPVAVPPAEHEPRNGRAVQPEFADHDSGSSPAAVAVEPPAPVTSRRAPLVEKVAPTKQTPTVKGDDLAEEVALIRSAKQALDRKSFAGSLALLDDYEARFPLGSLRGEARATRVLVLCAMNRPAQARAVAGQIDADSPLAKKLESGCPVK